MSTIAAFEDLNDPRPRKKEPPVVVIGPRGETNERPGPIEGKTTCGGDAIAVMRDGEIQVPKRHRRGDYEINDKGEQVITGWILYKDLCEDLAIQQRHNLTHEESMDYYHRHMAMLAMRDRGNDITGPYGDGSGVLHPEVLRRRSIPADSGRKMTDEQFAAELGLPAPKKAKKKASVG